MARGVALAAALAASLLAVSGAGGAPAQTPKRGGTVAVALPQEPACLNPFIGACGLSGFPNPVLEGAFELRPDFTFRPQLVSHVTIEERDPFTVTYHIRPRARWNDGVSITASDFLLSYGDGRTLPEGLRLAIQSVRAVDEKTVRVTFHSGRRYAEWKTWLFSAVFPRHALAGEDLQSIWRDELDSPKTGRPIGSGPFLVERWDRGRQLTLVRNPRYWGRHTAYLERIVLRFVPLGDHAAALRRGDVDLITIQAEDLLRVPEDGVRVEVTPSTTWEHLDIRVAEGGQPVLRSKLVRQALAYGIDRPALRRQLDGRFSGEGGAIRRLLDSVVLPTRSPFYRPNWQRYRYRPNEARRLLAQAGCRRGPGGFLECAGEPLVLRFLTTAGNPRRELTLELLREQLGRVGIAVRAEYAPSRAFFSQIAGGDFDVALFAWERAAGVLTPYYTFRCSGENNLTGYCNRLVTRDLVQTPLVMRDGPRAMLQNRVDRRLARDVPAIPLFEHPALVARRETVQSVAPNPGGDIMWNAENWWLER